jgi:methylated-DNA-[protein]-cysteine S-methyltransferase
MIHARHFSTPLGKMFSAQNAEGALLRLGFCKPGWKEQLEREVAARHETLVWEASDSPVARQIQEYCCGARREFDLPLAQQGSEFQHKVWEELRRIPYGQTITYHKLAQRSANPAACRAVGRANATNGIAIIIPCHRVIGSNGTLTGYVGGSGIKEKLLRLEGALQPELFSERDG